MFLLNLGEFTSGRLLVHADRVGTISETTGFLADLESAYVALFQLDCTLGSLKFPRRFMPPEFFWAFGPAVFSRIAEREPLDPASMLPEFRLRIQRVRIESPGVWEFLGAQNPLVQIREYLNDRHKRRQDQEFREAAEAEKLRLENELVQRSVWEKENSVLRDRIAVLRDLGYTDADIRQLIWLFAGRPLARLGAHQDTKMIEDAES